MNKIFNNEDKKDNSDILKKHLLSTFDTDKLLQIQTRFIPYKVQKYSAVYLKCTYS